MLKIENPKILSYIKSYNNGYKIDGNKVEFTDPRLEERVKIFQDKLELRQEYFENLKFSANEIEKGDKVDADKIQIFLISFYWLKRDLGYNEIMILKPFEKIFKIVNDKYRDILQDLYFTSIEFDEFWIQAFMDAATASNKNEDIKVIQNELTRTLDEQELLAQALEDLKIETKIRSSIGNKIKLLKSFPGALTPGATRYCKATSLHTRDKSLYKFKFI